MAAYQRADYKANRLAVLAAANYRCQWPGCDRVAVTADHVLPLARGGTNDLANLRASCRRCNSRGGVAITNEVKRARRIGRRSRRW